MSAFVVQLLWDEGFTVIACADWPECANKMKSERFDCYIFDRHVPTGDSLKLLSALDRKSVEYPPILFLTALDTLEQKIDGLAIADDYLAKPFAASELVARLRALLRRRVPVSQTLHSGGVVLNRVERRVSRNDQQLELNTMEFKLLEYLMLNKGHPVSRKMLLQNVWEYDFEPATSIVETYISRLRTKLTIEGEPDVIQTIRGVGYSINDE